MDKIPNMHVVLTGSNQHWWLGGVASTSGGGGREFEVRDSVVVSGVLLK